ncbi:hypothetical protein GRB70_12955 [Bradyrhizobium neotropicale]|nr:hypothetical protein [Bradyrhizobium neotropicale]
MRGNHFFWTGGAVFSAGAGGSAGCAPVFCASGSGRAGSGAGVVGRSPPGFDSAGFVCGSGGEDCTGGVACATSSDWCAVISTSEAVEITSPPTNRADAIRRSFR